jgi:hypothetical protein
MIVRLLNLVVIAALILAASYVYQIKFDSAVQAEHLAKLRGQVRRERDAIATLRAEWGQLDNPARIELLAKRHLPLKPIVPTQFDTFDRLPERPPNFIQPDSSDPIGAMIENLEEPETITGSIAPPADDPPETPAPSSSQVPDVNPDSSP